MVNMSSTFEGSLLISCCIYCWTAKVLSISSKGSSGQRQKSLKYHTINHRIETRDSMTSRHLSAICTHVCLSMMLRLLCPFLPSPWFLVYFCVQLSCRQPSSCFLLSTLYSATQPTVERSLMQAAYVCWQREKFPSLQVVFTIV